MRAITYPLALGLLLTACGSTPVTKRRPTPGPAMACGIERSQREPSLATFSAAEARACENACDQGDFGSCVTLGLAYEKGFGVHRDGEAAFDRYHRACARGHVPACSHEAWLQLHGLGTNLDPAQAVTMARRTCDQGDAYGCFVMGDAIYEGRGVAKDVARAAVFFRRACDAGEVAGCANLGVMYANGEGVVQNLDAALALEQRACNAHDPKGCFVLGQLQLATAVAAQNANATESALKVIEQSCRDGDASACVFLGQLFTNEHFINTPDVPRAAEWYALAAHHGAPEALTALGALGDDAREHLKNRCNLCKQDDATMCAIASSLFAFAAETAPSNEPTRKEAAKKEAAALADRGCTLGQPTACALLATHYAVETGGLPKDLKKAEQRSSDTRKAPGTGGLPKDLKEAQQLADDACRHGVGEGCETLAALLVAPAPDKPPDYAASFPLVRRACRLRSMSACTTLGWMYTYGYGTPMNRDLGFRLLERSCNVNDGQACYALAKYHDKGWKPATRDVARATQLLEKACSHGNASACYGAGTHYLNGDGVSLDYAKGFGFVKRACDAGDKDACRHGQILSAIGVGTGRDRVHGEKNLRALCKEEEWMACRALGVILAEKDAGFAEAASLWEKACSAGDSGGCSILGENHLLGNGTPKDPAKAATYIGKACSLGDADACSLKGTLYLQGQGVTASASVAATFQKQACDAGNMRGCAALAEQLEHGQGVERDFAKAATLHEKACTGDYAAACHRFGEMLFQGIGVPKRDRGRGVDILEKAARLGDTDAITKLLDLRADGWVAPRRLETTLEQACNQEAWPACRSLASLWWNPPAKSLLDKRPADALQLAQRACDHDDLAACGIVAQAYEKGAPPMPQRKPDAGARIIPAQKVIPRDPKRALDLYKKGCGNDLSSAFSGASLEIGPKNDAHSTVAPISTAEQRSDGASCAGWARLEPKRARELLERACRAGHRPTCAALRNPGRK